MNKSFFYIFACATLTLAGCSDADEPGGGVAVHETTQSLEGKVEKGPFVRGSIVEIRTLNADMSATGKSFIATIENNSGDFNFGTITAESQFAKLAAEGYFFNEVTGELSPGTISLNAIVDLTDSKSVNVNLLTHLKSERISSLVKEGSTYSDANARAQKELLTAFGLQNLALKDASQFSITSGDDAAGALIAISSLVLYDRSVAETVEFISQLTDEFSQLGTFRPGTKATLRKNRNQLNSKLSEIEANVRNRYLELGTEIEVKDLAFYFDWDDDGIAGNELERGTVTFSQDKLSVPANGGDFIIEINSQKPYFLEVPEAVLDGVYEVLPPGSVTPGSEFLDNLYEFDYIPKTVKYTNAISKNVISIHVDAAEFYNSQKTHFAVFNARGIEVGSIEIEQEGQSGKNSDSPKLGRTGEGVFGDCVYRLNASYKALAQRERSFFKNPADPIRVDDTLVYDCWNSFYSTINSILWFKGLDANMAGVYQEYLNVHLALIYSTMIVYWGDVVFLDKYNTESEIISNITRKPKSEIIDTLLKWTEEPLQSFKEDKVDVSDLSSILFLNKDIVRLIRARLYMEKGDYHSALPLLETVINGSQYYLTKENYIRYDDTDECILGLYTNNNPGYENVFEQDGITFTESVTPLLDLKEVYMAAAECAFHVSGVNSADRYISDYLQAKGLSTDNTGLQAIEDLRIRTLLPFTTPCVRRSGLDNNIIGLNGQTWHQMLWPIPSPEIDMSPGLTQNPGY